MDQNAFWSAMGLNVTKATQLIFYDNDGKPILFSDEHVMTSDNLSGYIIFSSGKEDEWHVRSFVKRSEALGTVYEATRMGVVMSVIVVICAAALSVLISRAITHNIDTLVQATNSLGSGVFGEEIPVRSHDEIGHLTVHFSKIPAIS